MSAFGTPARVGTRGARKAGHRKAGTTFSVAADAMSPRMAAALHVRMSIRWLVPAGKARLMTEALHRLMATTNAEPGCISCSVSADVAAKGLIKYTEEWETEEALQRQFHT